MLEGGTGHLQPCSNKADGENNQHHSTDSDTVAIAREEADQTTT